MIRLKGIAQQTKTKNRLKYLYATRVVTFIHTIHLYELLGCFVLQGVTSER